MMQSRSKRSVRTRSFAVVIAIVVIAAVYGIQSNRLIFSLSDSSTHSVGILYSMSRETSRDQAAVVETIAMALDEINESGGLLGQKVDARFSDAGVSPGSFVAGFHELTQLQGLSVIFGVGTSADRKSLLLEIESSGKLFFYPGRIEGLELSPNIVYTGATPNQVIFPIVQWAKENIGKRFALIGSDTVYSRVVHEIVGDYLEVQDIELVGSHYVGAGGSDLESVVRSIEGGHPDVIFSTLTGPDSLTFFQALLAAGIESSEVPTISFGIAGSQLPAQNQGLMIGHYVAGSYFDRVDSSENQKFVARVRARISDRTIVTAEMQSAYVAVRLWAAAVRDAQSFDSMSVRRALSDQSLAAPEGIVYVDSRTHYLWKPARLMRIQRNGEMKIVWSSLHSIRPHPFPDSRLVVQWNALLEDLSEEWHGSWQTPEA